MAGHRELVDRLVEDARPVRCLWPPGVRLALWLGVAVLVVVTAAAVGLRHDLPDRLRDGPFLLELAALLAAAGLLAGLALRAAVPGREPSWREAAAAAAMVAIAALFWVRLPLRTDVAISAFVASGAGCLLRTVAFAGLPWAILLLALHRGAPLAPGAAGVLAGAAAFVLAFAVMRLSCQRDELLHVVMWHAGPVIAGTAASAAIGLTWLRRWRGRASR